MSNQDMTQENQYKRPGWDEYFNGIMKAVSKRSTCDRGRSGCVIVIENRILTTGYTGSPPGLDHCDDVGHLIKEVIHQDGSKTKHCVRTNHAEENAIVQAARHGLSLKGATLYSKMIPCFTCAKMIVNAGIVRVVSENDYHVSQESKDVFKKANITFEVVSGKTEEYSEQN